MIAIFQHGNDEPAGELLAYLRGRNVPLTIHRLYETGIVPVELPSGLIVLGGQMSVNETREHPFIRAEMMMIRKMVAGNRPVLGICLGAQMIAASFGQRVYGDTREQGWIPVAGCGPGRSALFPDRYTVFHWHNETFDLPEGATLLVRGSEILNQAFRLGSAVGVQYHPEVTPEIIARWAESLSLQERILMMKQTETYQVMNHRHCHLLAEAFLRGWGA
jgi:GMP synthase-like glutamine amidotransferase